jgi:hypothetical protein
MICRLVGWLVVIALCGEMAVLAAGHSIDQTEPTITLEWDPIEDPPAGYVVYVGVRPHMYDEVHDVGSSTSFKYRNGVPGQRYYFAVAAYVTGPENAGPRSSTVSTIIPGAPTTIFLQPARVEGSSVTLAWSHLGSTPIGEYLLEAGSASGLSNLYTGSQGRVTSMTATVAPAEYFVRLRGRTSTGRFILSNEVRFSAVADQCTAAPSTPVGVFGSVTAGVAWLQWLPVPSATSYYLLVGSASGFSDVFRGSIGMGSQIMARVGPGFEAYARVLAVNACGQSGPSNEVLVR